MDRNDVVRGATWNDFDAVVKLLIRQNREATGIAAVREEFVRSDWELPSFEVGNDNWVSGADGYAAVSPKGVITIAAADDAAAEELFVRALARARARGDAKIELTPLPGNAIHASLLERHPFELEIDLLVMWRALKQNEPEPLWPEGITARTFAAGDAHAVHSLLDEAYRGWDKAYVPLAHGDWTRFMTGDVEFDATTWWLAERGNALVGCALWWSSGWLKDIVVRESERGRGLGGALVQQGIAEFARRGSGRVGLKVDAANPTGAVALYEHNGFVTERREQIWALSL